MNPEKKTIILTALSNCPIMDTVQIASFFSNKQPEKRASEAMQTLLAEKLVEGYNRGLAGKTKLWRLSKKGRELMNVTRSPVPLSTRNADHWLGIADVWLHLSRIGKLIRWKVELREPITSKRMYCGDIFYALRRESGTQVGFIEVQRSPITGKRWGEKWGILSEFMSSESFKVASFQDFKNKDGKVTLKPNQFKIIVVTDQQPDTVQAGSRLTLTICRDIKKAPL